MNKITYINLDDWLRLNDLRQYELYTELYIGYQTIQDILDELIDKKGGDTE